MSVALITRSCAYQYLEERYIPSIHPEVPPCLVNSEAIQPAGNVTVRGVFTSTLAYSHEREKCAKHNSTEGTPKDGSSPKWKPHGDRARVPRSNL